MTFLLTVFLQKQDRNKAGCGAKWLFHIKESVGTRPLEVHSIQYSNIKLGTLEHSSPHSIQGKSEFQRILFCRITGTKAASIVYSFKLVPQVRTAKG